MFSYLFNMLGVIVQSETQRLVKQSDRVWSLEILNRIQVFLSQYVSFEFGVK